MGTKKEWTNNIENIIFIVTQKQYALGGEIAVYLQCSRQLAGLRKILFGYHSKREITVQKFNRNFFRTLKWECYDLSRLKKSSS